VVVSIKALACELPYQHEVPLSRYSIAEICREAIRRGLVASIGTTTVWRWLSEDAIRPWTHRNWIFPRDPQFKEKADRVLELYEGFRQGIPLKDDEFLLSTDEKTSIQARIPVHPTEAPAPGRPMRVEHEYRRAGAWAYFAAWDIRRAKLFGRCEQKTGIDPFHRLVAQVMGTEPYRSARRVFWIMDNGSSHRGQASIDRLTIRWPTLVPVHTPVHASWLNQIEIYFSIIQRKVLTPNDFSCLNDVADRLYQFERYYEQIATPFQWKFTRSDLEKLLTRIQNKAAELTTVA
jgi:hypothetical protein